MPHGIRAFIFDLDGTLLNSLEDIADAANAALAAHGYAAWPLDAYRHFVGSGLETLMRRSAPHGASDETVASLSCAMKDNYAAGWRNKTRPYEGVPQMLAKLSEMRFPLAVLSNKAHHFTTIIAQHFFPTIPFVRVQGKPDGGKGKPDPALALTIADDMGVLPERTAFVGDSSVDMDTATAAGMLPMGVLWGFRPKDEMLRHGARLLLQYPLEIIEQINVDTCCGA